MREFAPMVLCALALAASGQGLAAGDLQGTTRVGTRPERFAAVWLDAVSGPVQSRKIVLDQRNLSFSPHVLVVRVGTTIDFPNNDRVFHNVFSFRDGRRFDLGMYPVGTAKPVTFDQPGLSRIFCNIHPTMAAYVLVVDSGLLAVSDANGQFTIARVPQGSYTYHAWRPGDQTTTGTVAVQAASWLEIDWR